MSYHKHHRRMRSQGGSGHPNNILKVTPELHQMIHHNPEVAYKHGLLVHSWDDPAHIEVDIPAFLAELGHEHEHKASCEFCGEQLKVKPKRTNHAKDSPERRDRKRVTIAVPNDRENGGQLWDEILDAVKMKLDVAGLINPETYPDPIKYPAYEALVAALWDWLMNV